VSGRVSAVIRRTALALGALAAVASLSSCSTFSRSDAVASVDDQEMTREQLDVFTDGNTTGDAARLAIGRWLQVAAVGADLTDITTLEELQAAAATASAELAEPFLGEAETAYRLGLEGSPALCLGAVVLAEDTDPQVVIDAMQGGMSLADAATEWSADPSLAESGGVVADQNGNTCLATDGGVNPDVITQLTEAGAAPGIPVAVQLANSKAVVVIREWDDLTKTEQVGVLPSVQTQVAAEVNARIQNADVFVDSRYGRWDAATGSVVPFTSK
jgi:hypothetical protein